VGNEITGDIFSYLGRFSSLFYIFFTILVILIAYWTYQDARKRGFGPYFWLILIITTGIVFPYAYYFIKKANWVFLSISIPSGGLIPWLIYLLVRPPWTKEDLEMENLEREALNLEREYWAFLLSKEKLKCPNCGAPIKENWLVCPYCHTRLKKECVYCGKPLELDWDICPYCGHEQPKEEKKK